MTTDIVERLLWDAAHQRSDSETEKLEREAADEIERLRALKTPASRQLLNITKSCLDNAEAEVKRLEARLTRHVDIAAEQEGEIERLNIRERLRDHDPSRWRCADTDTGTLVREAADEIERLTAECEAWRECAQLNADRYTKAADEIELLRDTLKRHAGDVKDAMQEIERLRAALEIIAGRRQCLDNLMSNAEVARAALTHRPRDDGTVVAVGGEPGASAGKSE